MSEHPYVIGPDMREAYFALIGRNDTSAYGFTEDVEACVNAWCLAMRSGGGDGLPKDVGKDLVDTVRVAAELRSLLYRLPQDIKLLIDLQLLSEGSYRRLNTDMGALVDPLEDLVAAISEVRQRAEREAHLDATQLQDKLYAAIGSAYRNRLNRKPTADEHGHFMQTLHGVLALVARSLPEAASLAVGLSAQRLAPLLDRGRATA